MIHELNYNSKISNYFNIICLFLYCNELNISRDYIETN